MYVEWFHSGNSFTQSSFTHVWGVVSFIKSIFSRIWGVISLMYLEGFLSVSLMIVIGL